MDGSSYYDAGHRILQKQSCNCTQKCITSAWTRWRLTEKRTVPSKSLSFPDATPSEHATRGQRTGSSRVPGFQVQSQGCRSELGCQSIRQLDQHGVKKELGEGWAVGETGTEVLLPEVQCLAVTRTHHAPLSTSRT